MSLKRKTMLFLVVVGLCRMTALAAAEGEDYQLPEGAKIIETQPLRPNRSLILWMVRPTQHPRDTPGDPYTCPEYTRGCYYSGATRVSLVDPQSRRVIHTVKITTDLGGGSDEFVLPYQFRSVRYDRVV